MSRIVSFFTLFFLCTVSLFAQAAPELRRDARLKRFPVVEPAKQMVESLLLPQGGLKNADVIDVMQRIPRNRFVPPNYQVAAYWDEAVAIGESQTISPPYIVAYMTEQLAPKPGDKVLEIGTGSGYQAAVLSLLVDQVYTIEIVEPLGKQAEKLLKELGMGNVHVKIGDGYKGWADAAPFDSIIVTCSPESIPQPLIDQLKEGGRMIIPVGERYQQAFYLCKKNNGKLEKERLEQVLFVPMTGEAESQRQVKPDSSQPAIIRGDFKEKRKDGTPVGWHYARNVEIISTETKTGSGNIVNAARFTRPRQKDIPKDIQQEPLALVQILQGFPVDGRSVSSLKIDYWMRGEKVVALFGPVMTLTAYIRFYDEDRNPVEEFSLGRCTGTFNWKQVSREIRIKPEVREAVLLIGLPAASGQLDVRDVSVKRGK